MAHRKIIWSVDPFEEIGKHQQEIFDTLRVFSSQVETSIVPTYVLSPEQLDLNVDFSPPWLENYRPATEKALAERAKVSKLSNLLPPQVVVYNQSSLRGSVRALASFAKTSEADAIVMGSHGRKGVTRLFMGSFAETLLLESEVPLIVVGPEAHQPAQIKRILFPTDLTEKSSVVYDRVLDMTKDLGAELTLLNVIPKPLEPVFQSGVYLLSGGWVTVPAFLETQEKSNRSLLNQWAEKGISAGVKVNTLIDAGSSSVVESILSHIDNQQIDWVCMAAQSGPIASALIGSVTRQTLRHSSRPLWVLHSP